MSSSTGRIVLTVVISLGILLIWNRFFTPKPKPRKAPVAAKVAGKKGKTPAEHGAAKGTAASASSQASSQPTSGPTSRGTVKAAASVGPVVRDKEGKQTTLPWRGGNATITFTELQGALRHVVLENKRYKEFRGGKLSPIDLVQTEAKKGPWPLQAAFPDSDFVVPANARYKLIRRDSRELVYEWTSQKVQIRKYYLLDDKRPVLWLDIEVENRTKTMLDERLKMKLFAQQDAQTAKPGMTNPYPRIPTALCHVNGKIQRRSAAAIAGTQSSCSAAGCGMGKGPVNMLGQVNWVASDDRYFLTALVPRESVGERACEIKLLPKNPSVVQVGMLFPRVKIKPGAKHHHRFMVYLGPKVLKELDAIKGSVKGGGKTDLEMSSSIEFGWFAILCRPMLWLMTFFHSFVGNWGLAIILLTLVVKLLTFIPTHKSMKSMRSMQRLKPQMDALKEKYGADKARLNTEMMNLYKVHKVNPLGGCLPMLIQMPVWFALYRTLGNAQELYRSGFVGWITDLTAPDQYYVLPILMGISMFAQQAITPQPMEGTQAKVMKYFMPGMFTFMMLWLPAGLTLYIFVNTLLTMVHQWHMNRSDPLPTKEESAKQVEAIKSRGSGGSTPPRVERRRAATGAAKAAGESSARTRSRKRRRKKGSSSSDSGS